MSVRPLALPSVIALIAAIVAAAAIAACNAVSPPNRPIETCEKACKERAKQQCTSDECARGCEFILDRLVEREVDNVVACVARTPRKCTDVVWADCGAKVGPHADGGPPAPPPPEDDFE